MEEKSRRELLSLTNDYVFRKIFGQENLSALAEFLADVLDMTVDDLGKLLVDDPHMHRDRKDGKSNVLDIRVQTKSGEIINIEVQVNPERGLEDCVNRFQWYNSKNGTLLTKVQEIDVLELPKLPQEDDGSRLWRWLKFLKSGREDEMEELAKDNRAMQDVMITLRKMSADEYERRLAEQREKDEWVRIGQIEYGRMEGEDRAKQRIVCGMKKEGISADVISRVTGLSAEEVEKL